MTFLRKFQTRLGSLVRVNAGDYRPAVSNISFLNGKIGLICDVRMNQPVFDTYGELTLFIDGKVQLISLHESEIELL